MEDLNAAMNDHIDQMADLLEKLSAEFRAGLQPAYDNFIGFFHAINWKCGGLFRLHCQKLSVPKISTRTDKPTGTFACAFALKYLSGIDFQEPWLIGLMSFHVVLLLVVLITRRNINFQICMFLMALTGVYLAENINTLLAKNWRSFAGQNYFDPHGLFFSVLWSGPLILISIIILVNSLISLCYLIVRWKKAELRHRARISRGKQD